MNDNLGKVSAIIGTKVVRANSTLHQFAVEFSENQCLLLDAKAPADGDGPTIDPSLADSSKFPSSGDAVCAVDWSWIYGGEVKDVKVGEDQVRLVLHPQGPVTISAGVWQGKPFLSFMPYKAPVK